MLKRGTSVLIKIDKVSIKDNYIELLITSNTNVDNIIINIDKETINLPITINKYESKLVNFYTNTTNPTSLIIYFYISTNRITTNNQGNTVYQANFQPYGNIFTEEGTEKYKFSNKELDSSNLYYFGARYYNSNTGRFTQVDPIFNPSISPYY